MNVTELARKLKIPTAKLREIMPELGFDIGKKAIKVDDKVAEQIVQKIKENKNILLTKEKKTEKEVEEKTEEVEEAGIIKLPTFITVRDFATSLNKPVVKVIQELMKNGILANLNEQIDYETAAIIASDFGFKTKPMEEKSSAIEDAKIEELLEDKKSSLKPRPPVVVVMGHVDHGKTKLLDAIRKTNVVASESGGITQHIGAYQVEKKGKSITFIDTPGHEAFSTMRSRGARVADIAILVIAADDGIKPQTEEAIKIIESAKLPFVVAINKIDKPDANIDKVKQQLSSHNLVPEEWGGHTVCSPISAQTGQGVNELLDTLLLVAEMEKENIKANPNREAVGTIIESHIDKGEGPVATVLIQTGTLHIGELVKVGQVAGKIKAMKDYQGHNISAGVPSMPVKIIGLKHTPEVGDILQMEKDLKSLKKVMKDQQAKIKHYRDRQTTQIKEEEEEEEKVQSLNLILKTDTLGSQEAVSQSLEKWQPEDLKIKIVKKGLGNIMDNDILTAESNHALIYGFHVAVNTRAQELAQSKGIEPKVFQLIYELIDDVKKEIEKLLKPEIIKIELGRAKILAIFRKERKSMIVGAQVTKGKLENNTKAKILRNKEEIGEGKITELQMAKKAVQKVPEGSECGIQFEGPAIIEIGDFLQLYKEEKKLRKLV